MSSFVLSFEAELDLENIVEYTIRKHGEDQILKYVTQLQEDTEQLALGMGHYKQLTDIHPKLRMVKSGKHYVFGITRENDLMIVIAILHERMNLVQRLKNRLL
ncbi:type II toxin-antitoxin system RelE/ParE family toxin [Tenacibaculum agarivorans]|uniref:type II toxin-antitoxin system RelE/ParE family toxin n=1 Tax=Tenacibaculum agarivorans TaxID=1908389 RepID=UPI00094B959B|nr:type II toxin-antitoxin system RelE/ParE family toxin [Tenacibaculum agarivorans]